MSEIDPELKQLLLERLEETCNPVKDNSKCFGSIWLTEDGKMFSTVGHRVIGDQTMKDMYSDYIRHETYIPMYEFMNKTNSIRLSCTRAEIDAEIGKDNRPTEEQRRVIKQVFCDDVDKRHLILEKNSSKSTDSEFTFSRSNQRIDKLNYEEMCDTQIDKMIDTALKYP